MVDAVMVRGRSGESRPSSTGEAGAELLLLGPGMGEDAVLNGGEAILRRFDIPGFRETKLRNKETVESVSVWDDASGRMFQVHAAWFG
jgi:hypothetical protein